MNNIKIITLFHANENIPSMTYIVKDVEEKKHGIKLTLENDNNIYIKDYDFFSYQNQQMLVIRNVW